MSYQIKIKDFTASSAKRIKSSDVNFRMSADAMWFSGLASNLVDEETLTNSDLHWIVILSGGYVEIQFTADVQGQGIRIPSGCESIRITSVTNTVKRLHLKDGDYGMTKQTAYTNGSAITIAVDDLLDAGDYLVFSSTGVAQIKFTAPSEPTFPFLALPIGLLANSDR